MRSSQWFIAQRFLFSRLYDVDRCFKKYLLFLLACLFISFGGLFGGTYFYFWSKGPEMLARFPDCILFLAGQSSFFTALLGLSGILFFFSIRRIWPKLLLGILSLAGLIAGLAALWVKLGPSEEFGYILPIYIFQALLGVIFLGIFLLLFLLASKNLILITTLISIAGVAVGVAALLIVIGVIDGVDQLLFSNISALYPHVRIKSADGSPLVIDQALVDRLKARSDVVLAQPVIEKEAMLQRNMNGDVVQRGIRLIGVSELGPGTLYPAIFNRKTGGVIQLGTGEVLVGMPLFMELGMGIDEPVQVVTTAVIKTALYNTFRVRRERVLGYFNTPLYDFNASTAFVSAEEIRDLYRMPPGTADYIFIKLRDPFAAGHFKATLGLPASFAVSTWNEENGDFFGALKLERLGLWLILLLIVFVAALNIIGTLILMVIEKTREVGILRAIGASERLVARIFLVDGMMIGVVGTLVGLAIGITVCLLIPRIDIRLPAAVLFEHLPVKIKFVTVSMVTGASLIICTLAAAFPARKAARLNPVEALRYD